MDPGLIALGALVIGVSAFLKKNTQHNVPPRVGNVPPRVGNVPPRVGNVPPRVGNVPPRVGNVPPRVGNVPPRVGKEGFEVVPSAGYSDVAQRGQEMYNTLTLSSDPRQEAVRVASMNSGEQNAYQQAMNTATGTPTNIPGTLNGSIQVQTQKTNVPVYIGDQNSIMLRAAYCEKKTITPNIFDTDPQFARDCGVCLTKGRTNEGSSFNGIKGLFIEETNRRDFLQAQKDNGTKYSKAQPSLGSCEGSYTFAVNKEELTAYTNRSDCQKSRNLDGNCATCLQDGSFTYVGSGKDNLDAVTFTVSGAGTLSATIGDKVIEFATPTKDAKGNLVKITSVELSAQRPTVFQTIAPEDAPIRFTVLAPSSLNMDTPAQLYGIMEVPNTTGGVLQISLDKILLNDDILGGKPKKGRTFPTITTKNGNVYCSVLQSGFSKKSMLLTGNMPFLVVNDYAFDGIDCKGSLLQQKAASVERFGGDPCYKPSTQGPGTWTDACLKDRITSYGCVESGELFKNPSELRGLSMDSMRKTLEAIGEKQYSENVASMKCNGKDIRTPCDPYINFNVDETPDISPQCLSFLYENGGVDIPAIGPTYTGPINTYYSLDSKGKRVYCLPSAKNNPSTNPSLVKELQKNSRNGGNGRIGIPYVKDYFNAAYQRATNTGLNANVPDSQGGRADSIAKCYTTLADIPVYSVPPSPNASLPNARYARIRVPTTECLQISQLAVYDNQKINVAAGKRTTASTVWNAGSGPEKAVDGQLASRGHPNQFHSGCKKGDWWQVDLGVTYPITSVVYYNRADCCQARANGTILELLDEKKNVVFSTALSGERIQTIQTAPRQFNV